MLQWIRDKLQGIIIRLIAGVISLVFILGAGSYYLFNRNSRSKVVATVDGEEISSDIVDSIYNDIIKNFYANNKKKRNNNREELDLDPKKIRKQILVDVANNKAIISHIKQSGFIISKEQLTDFVKSNPVFQEKGKFSVDKYRALLRHNNISESEYQKNLQEHLLMEQLKNNILLSNFISEKELDNFITNWYQTRSFGYSIVPISKFLNKQVTDQEVKDYYEHNKKFFITPETVVIAYIDIAPDQLVNSSDPSKGMNANDISKDKLQKYYKEHLDYYTLPESVNVNHILISDYSFNLAKDEQNQDKQNKAKNLAEEILGKLKSGQDFSQLAKEYSDDQQSGQKGGNLGWINKDELEPNFEKAAFSLSKPGEFSDVVKTRFGYHIIQLVEKKEAKVNDYFKVADQVLKHYKEEQNQAKLQEILEKVSDSSIIKEDLEKVADKVNLKVQVTEPFSAKGTKEGISSYKEIIIAAFENQVKGNSLIKLTDDHFILFKVVRKQPSKEKSLEDSYDEIKGILQHSSAKEQANKYSLDLASKILALKSINKSTKIDNIEWKVLEKINRKDAKINAEILTAAFSLNKINPQKTFSLANGDFALVSLLSVQNPDLKKIVEKQPELKSKLKEQLNYLQSYVDQRLYEEDLLRKSKIKFLEYSDHN